MLKGLLLLSSRSIFASCNPTCYLRTSLFLLNKKMSQKSNIRHNFHQESESLLNKQINLELHASYVYQAMAWHFDRDDVALPGFHNYFKEASKEEREHGEKMMKYVNLRGGKIVLQNVDKPAIDTWTSGLEAMEQALQLEKTVNESLLHIHQVASSHEDPHLSDWLESEFLNEQVESIKQISEHITNLKRVGPGLGEYMYDKETLCKS